jgi:hypothetical protein
MPVRLTRDELVESLAGIRDVEGRILAPADAGHEVGVIRASHLAFVSHLDDGDPAGEYLVRFGGYTTVPGIVVAVV